jgi:hypothetical protein
MIPVPLFDLKSLMAIRGARAGTSIGGTGNGEKTNPCGTVKLEITGNGPMTDGVPANCSFSGF